MREFVIALIIALVIVIPLVYSAYHNDKIVENYCSIAYQHNVKDYKACRQLTQAELIEKLIKDFNEKNGIPDLEEIK